MLKSSVDSKNSSQSLQNYDDENETALLTLRKDLGIENLAESSEFDSEEESTAQNIEESSSEESENEETVPDSQCQQKRKIQGGEENECKKHKTENIVETSADSNDYSKTSNDQTAVGDIEDSDENDEKHCIDPFMRHFHKELHPNRLRALSEYPLKRNTVKKCWPILGEFSFKNPKSNESECESVNGLNEHTIYAQSNNDLQIYDGNCSMYIKPQIESAILKCNPSSDELHGQSTMTSFQNELFSIINHYPDLYFPKRTSQNALDITYVYCLHAVNHILKTRSKIIHHNSKLNNKADVPEEYRDQGLVRPKVLILVPFMNSAYKIVNMILSMLSDHIDNIQHHKRFLEEYVDNDKVFPKQNPKPKDYEITFEGNTNDDFKLSMAVTKKSVKLYTDFYSADIIIASPLGLRRVMGAEDESDKDYDFLASIELLILDQTEIFLMQNWEHVLHIFNHLHLVPKESHGTDFSRVRIWSLKGHAKFYRQTLIFSSIDLPEINSLVNKKCFNYEGNIKIDSSVEGTLSQIVVTAPHRFYKFHAGNPIESIDQRFDFFLNEILPEYKDSQMKKTMIYIPDYCDYVKLRNYFKNEALNFTQICEYSKPGKVARARDMFCNGDAHFLLYTERYHFYNRIRIKGIRHLIFYGPPRFPQFYSEICNLLQKAYSKQTDLDTRNVNMVYCKYDGFQLAAIVGTKTADEMLKSQMNVHMLVTNGL